MTVFPPDKQKQLQALKAERNLETGRILNVYLGKWETILKGHEDNYRLCVTQLDALTKRAIEEGIQIDGLLSLQKSLDAEKDGVEMAKRMIIRLRSMVRADLDGKYGYCVDCKKPIPVKSLEANPFVTRCNPHHIQDIMAQEQKRINAIPEEPRAVHVSEADKAVAKFA